MSLLVHVECLNNTIKCTVIDEGATDSVMSLSCWKGLGSPTLSNLGTMLTAFDGRSFWPHGILPSLEFQLGGKTVTIEVEVVDAPLINFYWVGTGFTICKWSCCHSSELFVFL